VTNRATSNLSIRRAVLYKIQSHACPCSLQQTHTGGSLCHQHLGMQPPFVTSPKLLLDTEVLERPSNDRNRIKNDFIFRKNTHLIAIQRENVNRKLSCAYSDTINNLLLAVPVCVLPEYFQGCYFCSKDFRQAFGHAESSRRYVLHCRIL
jgi:hypothetical protein